MVFAVKSLKVHIRDLDSAHQGPISLAMRKDTGIDCLWGILSWNVLGCGLARKSEYEL